MRMRQYTRPVAMLLYAALFCLPAPVQAADRTPTGAFELMVFGALGPEEVLDEGDIDTDSLGIRLGYFPSRALEIGLGYERVIRRGQSVDHTLQLLEPFLFYHLNPGSRFVPYLGVELEQRLDLGSGALGYGVGGGVKYYFTRDAALFAEGRVQLFNSPGDRTPVGGGILARF